MIVLTIISIILLTMVLLFIKLRSRSITEFFKVPYDNISKNNIYQCYSNVMTPREDDILNQLINYWNQISTDLGIRWSVCAGSYIGAIRHGGRIPWDDDFDVTTRKEDKYKLNTMGKVLSKYNISMANFWGGYKIFFNDHRAIKKFPKYGWNWPFIDIFSSIDIEGDCTYLDTSEYPLKKVKFGNTKVFIYQNPNKTRNCIKNKKWKTELVDYGYRHQLELNIRGNCKPRAKYSR